MALWLYDDIRKLLVEVRLADSAEAGIERQWERIDSESLRELFLRRLGKRVAEAIPYALDLDLQPPTPRQVAFATAISGRLGVPLPIDALRYRGHMGDFLDKYAIAFRLQESSVQVLEAKTYVQQRPTSV